MKGNGTETKNDEKSGGALRADSKHKSAFVAVGIGVNLCYAVYLSYIRVYGAADDSMLAYMKISIFAAAFFVTGLQGIAEKFGPSLMSPKTKYTACLSASIFVMVATLALMPFMHSRAAIVLFGILIGFFEGSGMTYLMELASCYSGDATRYANTGFVIALLLPVGLSFALGFYEEKTTRTMEVLFALIPSLICFIALVYFLYIVATGSFDAAFETMARKQRRPVEDGEDAPLLEGGERAARPAGEDVRWFETTLIICMVVMVLTQAMGAGYAPLSQVVVSLAYAHRLMLVRFTAEFLGRVGAHFRFADFGAKTMLSITAVRALLLVALVIETFGLHDLDKSERLQVAYAAQVWLFYFMGSYVNSEIMAIAVDSQPMQSRKVAYVMMLLTFGSNVASLLVVVFVLQSFGIA
jgi:hypothetical protein